LIWAFPLYWAIVTTIKPEHEVIRPYVELWPENFTLEAYVHIIQNTRIVRWYINSIITSLSITVLVVFMGATCGYAISQLKFPGRMLLWWMILASFMVPIQALIVNHFIIMADVKLVNTLPGIILPQLIAPVVVIVYKQFFDSVPRDFREAAVVDGASEFQLLFRIYLPMNWGVTTALAIITFIGAWNAFLWPFLITTTEPVMTVAVGITTVQDAFGIYYARLLAGAVMTGLPVATIYLLFQRRVTQAIMLTAGVKG
jgi:multiple sugar transport system permease protein